MSANFIASYLVKMFNRMDENDLTNLKLQKLLYFAQRTYLKKYNKILFEDKIEAWKYGPVVNSVYTIYSSCGSSPITNLDIPSEYEKDILPDEVEDHLDYVIRKYGIYSASHLVDKTHHEAPWVENYIQGARNVIPIDDLISFNVAEQ